MDTKTLIFVGLLALTCAQTGREPFAARLSDSLSSLPRIGFAPGIQQAVENTGAQPNPFSFLSGFGGQQSSQPGQLFQAPLQALTGLAQAGTQTFQGLAQSGSNLLQGALSPLQQLVQGRRK